MPTTQLVLTSILLTCLPTVLGWGDLGHETIAYVASHYVTSTTKSAVQSILSDTSDSYMANVSTWADSYRYTASGSWSYDLHFIDANDSPPSSCSVNFDRDCGSTGCSVSAVVNYTNILVSSSSSSEDSESSSSSDNGGGDYDAMKFLIHFIGDMHQPLHDEAIDVGGNTIKVTYDGEETNLHHIWDTEIVESLAGSDSDSLSAASKFADTLISSINSGEYGWNASSWLSGTEISDPQGTAMSWASEANAYVCSDVLVGGIDAVESGDLGTTYYQKHGDVARIQIAKAGYRLGAWLNLIYGSNDDKR